MIPLLIITGIISFIAVSSHAVFKALAFGAHYQKTSAHAQPSPSATASPIPSISPSAAPGSDRPANWSAAMGLWTPSKWDTCTKAEHDSYAIVGPDGKLYPTWHPPIHTRPDGSTCTFGHEHGRDPSGSSLAGFINQVYGGVLFGYANEKLDEWNASNGITNGMRREDHVGHKIEWENNLQMSVNDPSNPNGRIMINAYCDFLMKIHQGTHSKDAFANNLHELGYFAQCRDIGNTGLGNVRIASIKMVPFGNPGESIESCTKTTVNNGGAYSPTNSQKGGGARFIPDKYCTDKYVLVPQGQFSDFGRGVYEDWVSSNYLRKPDGSILAYFDPHFAVFTPSRYFLPGHVDPLTGQIDNMGRTIDLCFETEANGDKAYGGECNAATNYGQIKSMSYDDPRSPFNGVHREMYFNQTWINNVGGPSIWYTDPLGNNAGNSPFTGSIKQYLEPINNYNKVTLQSNALGKTRSYGGNGVHAPN